MLKKNTGYTNSNQRCLPSQTSLLRMLVFLKHQVQFIYIAHLYTAKLTKVQNRVNRIKNSEDNKTILK